jgi:chlorite dismutase
MKRKTPMPKSIKELEAEVDSLKMRLAEKRAELEHAKSRRIPEPIGWKYIAFEVSYRSSVKDYEYVGVRMDDGRWFVTGNGPEFANWQALVDWLREKHAVSPIRKLTEDYKYGVEAVDLYE